MSPFFIGPGFNGPVRRSSVGEDERARPSGTNECVDGDGNDSLDPCNRSWCICGGESSRSSDDGGKGKLSVRNCLSSGSPCKHKSVLVRKSELSRDVAVRL